MAQEDPNRLAEWLAVVRVQVPVVRQRLADYGATVREDPGVLWRTPAVRYATYLIAGLVLVWGVRGATAMLGPPVSTAPKPAATTADFHVKCSDVSCAHHFVIHREFGFDEFPVECPKCGQASGGRARKCMSKTCGGQWVAPRDDGSTSSCPTCARRFP